MNAKGYGISLQEVKIDCGNGYNCVTIIKNHKPVHCKLVNF